MENTNIETEINGVPQLCDIPDDVLDVFVSALLEEILFISGSDKKNETINCNRC